MNTMVKTALLTFSLIMGLSTQSFAGISSCVSSEHRTLDERNVLFENGQASAQVRLVQARYTCDLTDKVLFLVDINFERLTDGPLPNHGFISANIKAFDGAGKLIHEKSFDRSAFTTDSYPFTSLAREVVVEINGFEKAVFSL